MVNRRANALIGAGLQAGDRVAILAKNSIEYVLLYFAASKAGITVVPLNYRLAPPEWSYMLGDARPRVLFASGHYLTAIDAIRDGLATISASSAWTWQALAAGNPSTGGRWIGRAHRHPVKSTTRATATRCTRVGPRGARKGRC